MTSATNPSLEDIITGAIPGMPKVVVHNPVLAFENGAEFMQAWYDAEAGKLDPFVLILEGSLPNEKLNGDGYWAAMGDNPRHGPADHHQRVDRPPRAEGRGGRRGRDLRHLRRHPGDEEQPDRRDGPARLPRLELEVQGRHPDRQHPRLPGAARQHHRDAAVPRASRSPGMAPVPELDEVGRPKWLFGRTVRESCNRAGFYEQGNFATEYGSDHRCLVKLGCKGPVVKCNVPLRGWVNGIGGCPNVGGICMACTMPGFPDKYMPFMDADPTGGSRPTSRSSPTGPILRWAPQPEHQAQVRQGAGVAHNRAELTTGYAEALVEEETTMATVETTPEPGKKVVVKEMSWDPITRIVGSLGIHTEIDFDEPARSSKCYSTSMIFRGFDIFMKGIDPRDAHFITSRICGICGDNHCTTLVPEPEHGLRRQAAEARRLRLQPGRARRLHVRPRDLQRLHVQRGLLRADGQGHQPVAAREGREDVGAARATSTATRRSPTSCGRSTRSPATSTWRRSRWPATRARCTACSAAATRTRRRSCRAAVSADITHQTLHRLLRAADALHGLLQAHGADARRPLRLLPPRSCRATTWSATARRTSSAGARSTTPTTSTTTTRT